MSKIMLLLCIFCTITLRAQLNTSGYRVDQRTTDIEVCQSASEATYVVTAKTSTLNNFEITLALPPGVDYIIGSLSIISSPSGYTITEVNTSNTRTPVLAINRGGNPANLWNVGDQVTFKVSRTASCPSVIYSTGGGTFKDTTIIDYESNGIQQNGVDSDTTYATYNVDYASLSILAINNINTTLNTPETRNVTIRQGGNSCIERLQHFVVVGRNIANYQLRFGGTLLTPTSIVPNTPVNATADTLFYTFDLNNAPFLGVIGNGNNCFENGEDIVLTESLSATNCDNILIKHHAQWSCNGSQACQFATPQLGSISFVNGSPTLTITEIGGATLPELCDTINHTVRITNTATATTPAGGAIAFDVAIVFGLGHNGSLLATPTNNTLWGSARQDTRFWGNFKIGGTVVQDSALAYANNPANITTLGPASFLIQDRLTTDPDGPGVGLEDLDNDGFFDDLAPGASFEIDFDYWIAVRNNCGSSRYHNYMTWEHKYFDVSFKDQCQIERTPVRRDLGYRNVIRNYLNSTFTSSPSDVFDGDDFVVGIMPHFYNNGYQCHGEPMFTASQATWSISLDLPPGIDTATSTISSLDSEFSALNPRITKVGNTVTYTMDRYVYDTLHFPLTFDCSSFSGAAIVNIPYTSHYFCGTPGDTCFYREIHCGTLSDILTHCPDNCNGPVICSFDASRTTPGYDPVTPNTLVNLDPAIHNTKFYNPFDTMLVQAKAYINDTAVNDLKLTINMTASSGGTDLLTFVGGEVLINDISSGTGYQSFVLDGMPANLTNVGGQNFQYIMDLSRYVDSMNSTYLYGGQVGSAVYTPDTILVKARFIFSANFSGQNPQSINPIRANFSTTNNGTVIACDSLGDLAQYERVTFGWGPSRSYPFTHCTPHTPYLYFTHSAFTRDDHPNEYRPPSHWDSVKFVIPNYAYTGTLFSWSNIPMTILPHRISGDTVTMYRPTGYNDRDKRGTYYPPFRAMIIGNCETPPVQTMQAWNYFKEFAYHPDPTVHQNRRQYATATLRYDAPEWSFQALSPVVNGVQDTIFWDVEICNTTSGSDIDYNWFFIPPQPNINIESIYNITSGTEVAMPYTVSNDSTFLELGGLNSNVCKRVRIYATYTDCSNQVLEVNHGWDCQAYPVDYSTKTSACYRTLNLLLEPRASEVQLNILTQPTTAQALCTDTTYLIEVTSAQLADLTNPVLEMRGVTGVNFTNVTIEYPRNSGNIESVIPTIAAGTATINLAGHSRIVNNAIKGTANSTTSDDRFITIRLDVQFVCNFSPNSSLSFAVNATQPCGAPAIGNAIRTKTKPVQINGAVAPYNAYTGTTVSPSPIVVQNCTNRTNIRIQTTIIGDTTSANDTTEVFLPLGTTYVPGSYACTSLNCPTGISLDTLNGRPRVVFPFPSGIPSGATIDYSFDINGTPGGGCSLNELLEVNSYVIAGNISCQGTPCGPVKIITGEADERVVIEKPRFTISNLVGRSFNNQINNTQTYTITQDVTNVGIDAPAGVQIDYYCADATGNPVGGIIGSSNVGSPINTGQTVNHTTNFVVATSLPCTNQNAVVAQIRPSNTQCICEVASASYNNLLLPIRLTSFEAELIEKRKALLSWETNRATNQTLFEVEQAIKSPDNNFAFDKIGTVQGIENQKNYTFYPSNLTNGVHYFRIKTIAWNGEISYSLTKAVTVENQTNIKVHPNPTKELLNIDFMDVVTNPTEISVYSSVGQKVLSTFVQNRISTTLNVGNLPNGTYILKIQSKGINKMMRITIVR